MYISLLQVNCVELDVRMIAEVQKLVQGTPLEKKLTIIHGDALKVELPFFDVRWVFFGGGNSMQTTVESIKKNDYLKQDYRFTFSFIYPHHHRFAVRIFLIKFLQH